MLARNLPGIRSELPRNLLGTRNSQWPAKGATSKNVKNRQKVSKVFSTFFARHRFSGPLWGALEFARNSFGKRPRPAMRETLQMVSRSASAGGHEAALDGWPAEVCRSLLIQKNSGRLWQSRRRKSRSVPEGGADFPAAVFLAGKCPNLGRDSICASRKSGKNLSERSSEDHDYMCCKSSLTGP